MNENNVITDLLKVIGAVLGIVLAIVASIVLSIAAGYLVGMFIAILPFISDWLTQGLGVDKSQIPGIVAWFAVAGLWIGGSVKAGKGGKND